MVLFDLYSGAFSYLSEKAGYCIFQVVYGLTNGWCLWWHIVVLGKIPLFIHPGSYRVVFGARLNIL